MSQSKLFDELLEILSSRLVLLPDKPEETPETTLKALWMLAGGQPVSAVSARARELPVLDEAGQQELRSLIQRRLEGVPLAHLSGRQSFMGLELLAGPEALIPRRETELLAQQSIDLLEEQDLGAGLNVIDVCTGAGNLALAIASRLDKVEVFASDLSADAIELARRNTEMLGLTERVHLFTGDLLEPFRDTALDLPGKVDMITCNPPYISSAKVASMAEEISGHEPELAFNGGVFGINLMRRLVSEAPEFIRSGGHLLFEVGLGQGPAMQKQVSKLPAYAEAWTVADGQGEARVVVARVQ